MITDPVPALLQTRPSSPAILRGLLNPAGWRVILDEAAARVADRFVRAEPRRTAGQFVDGLLSGVERKT